jgi:alkanesulfonate monooxygenase SsuD/methylene tetrahydromethanopterin reductase-like flavin-dependent oxidoreductase (luciferase family)
MSDAKGAAAQPIRLSYFSVQDHYSDRERTIPQLYEQVIQQAELAELLRYDSFLVAEHHFHEYGTVPNPAVMLAAIAQRTKTLRLGPAISVLTFHDPLTVAENYAIVDILSNGRLVLGVGSGYLKHEFEGYAVALSEKRARFDENLAILRLALTGERFSYKGAFRNVDQVKLNITPIQQRVPIYVAVLAKEAAYHVGHAGNDIISVPYASLDRFEEIGPLMKAFKQGRAESKSPPHSGDHIFTFHTHVAETDAQCRENVEAAFNLYVATRLYAKRQTYDDIMRSQLALFGSVETVVDKIVALYGMGIRHVLTLQNFGLLAAEKVHHSMMLMAEEVMPRVHKRLAQVHGHLSLQHE